MEDFVAYELIWTCENGHEADTAIVEDPSHIKDYPYHHDDDCHNLTKRQCFGWVNLDRIEVFDTRKDPALRPEVPTEAET